MLCFHVHCLANVSQVVPPLLTDPLPYFQKGIGVGLQVGEAEGLQMGLLLLNYPAHLFLLLGLDMLAHFLLPLLSPEESVTAQYRKNRQQDLLVILGCYQQSDALYTLADVAWCLNWSQNTWLFSLSYLVRSTALK